MRESFPEGVKGPYRCTGARRSRKSGYLCLSKLGTDPRAGINVETVEYKNIIFNVWDVGVKDTIRILGEHYFPDTRAIIFVVDSKDRDGIDNAGEELQRILRVNALQGVHLLVLANKQDLPVIPTI